MLFVWLCLCRRLVLLCLSNLAHDVESRIRQTSDGLLETALTLGGLGSVAMAGRKAEKVAAAKDTAAEAAVTSAAKPGKAAVTGAAGASKPAPATSRTAASSGPAAASVRSAAGEFAIDCAHSIGSTACLYYCFAFYLLSRHCDVSWLHA